MKRFLRDLFLFCILLGSVIYAIGSQFGPRIIHPLTYYILGFFALLSALTYWVTDRLVRANANHFMAAYFGSVVARLLVSVGFVIVYFYKGGAKEGAGTWAFLGSFFLLYFLFAGFEIWSVLSNLRPFSKRG
jgi:hypothetical protein